METPDKWKELMAAVRSSRPKVKDAAYYEGLGRQVQATWQGPSSAPTQAVEQVVAVVEPPVETRPAKVCTKCGVEKDLEEGFCRNRKSNDGRHYWCRQCTRENSRSWATANPEKRREAKRRQRIKNPDKTRAAVRRWQAANPEKAKEATRRWAKNNPDKVRAKRKRYSRSRYKKHPERARAATSAWLKRNPGKTLEYTQRRRARKRAAGGTFTAQQWRAVVAFYGNKCLACGATDVKLTVDHCVPLTLGGSNGPENLQPLCLSCNSSKSAKHIDYRPDGGEFARKVAEGEIPLGPYFIWNLPLSSRRAVPCRQLPPAAIHPALGETR